MCLFIFSYLANQCWSGGCLYLIMLRRVKQKAPTPPCNVSVNVSIPEDRQQDRDASERSDNLENCTRSRKFGVFSGPSFAQDNNTDLKLQKYYGDHSSLALSNSSQNSGTIQSINTCGAENPDNFPQVRTALHGLDNGGTAPLPARGHSHMIKCDMDSFSSDTSGQVRHCCKMSVSCFRCGKLKFCF